MSCAGPLTTSRAPTVPPSPTESQPAAARGGWNTRPLEAACEAPLRAFASGRLDDFRGLGRCGRVDAEAAFGASGDRPSKFEQFGEYRAYSTSGGTLFVWFLSDEIRVMQSLYPKLAKPLRTLLREPEAKAGSGLSRDWEQWIYASRGLTAHVRKTDGEVVALYAYRPTSVDAFLKSDVARAAKSESPIEELR